MAATKRDTGIFRRVFGRLLRAFENTEWFLLVSCLLLLGLGYGSYYLWQQYGDVVLSHADYQMTVDKIDVTPLPAWIRADVLNETVLSGSLEELDLRETELTVRVAQAFATHPWVARVKRVSKHYPARLAVDLQYRRPVAMVEVVNGLLPVDEQGVVLPTDDFSPEEARAYPRIVVGDTSPVGPPGTPWGDRYVTWAAQIASAIGDDWHRLRLYRIVTARRSSDGTDLADDEFELWTRSGGRIRWGRAPGEEAIGEAKAAHKLSHLVKLVENNGSLDDVLGANTPIDVRNATAPPVLPKTARRQPAGEG